MSAAILHDRSVLQISGEDAQGFLQGLVTNDMARVRAGTAISTALLNPQGKILFDFFITGAKDGYLIDCAGGQRADLIKRLNMYKLRSKVEISDPGERCGVAVCRPGADAFKDAASFRDPRHEALGVRVIANPSWLEKTIEKPVDYHAIRIGLGIAEGGQDFAPCEVFPHEANFDQLNGVSFTKGCYVGQEVVSRMHHKTGIRKRFLPVTLKGPAPEAGSPVFAGEKKAGIMGSSAGNNGLALLRFDRIDGADALNCGGARLEVQRPDWADFEIPGV